MYTRKIWNRGLKRYYLSISPVYLGSIMNDLACLMRGFKNLCRRRHLMFKRKYQYRLVKFQM